MKIFLFLAALPLFGQQLAPQPTAPSIHITIAYPGPAILRSTYGITRIPRGYVIAQVTAANHTPTQIDIGEGDVIQIFKSHGLEAWPARNGAALLNAQQGHTAKYEFFKWGSVVLVVAGETMLSGVGNLSPAAQKKGSLSIGLAASVLGQVAQASNAVPANTYASDGMQATEQISAHQSITRLVLMTTPAAGAVSEFDVVVR